MPTEEMMTLKTAELEEIKKSTNSFNDIKTEDALEDLSADKKLLIS